jgi:hypothetical protein
MAVKATATTRAPRGTKTLTQAFFSAADEIPETQRDAVVKAALAAIRDQLKDDRDTAKLAKAKAKVKAGKAPTAVRPKLAAPAPKKQPVAALMGKKTKANRGRKVSPTPEPETEPESGAM